MTDLHGAVISSVSPVTVTLDGSATAVPAPYHLGAYTPTLADRVTVAAYRGALLVLGKEVTP